jgi:hypothetical protein
MLNNTALLQYDLSCPRAVSVVPSRELKLPAGSMFVQEHMVLQLHPAAACYVSCAGAGAKQQADVACQP